MAYIKLQNEPIDVAGLYAQLKSPEYGGIGVFVGTIRNLTDFDEESKGGARTEYTDFIEYTAYEAMAIKELKKLAAPIEMMGNRVIIVHRIGHLEVEDEAVFIGVASVHRKQALEGCHQIIDQLKKTVPIWKKEVDGDTERWGK
ncbi:molybdenum cofactor biosynthesis protein MoaE [Lactococcus allomyrinae]|uniref:Molybdenum cofactor biosynthesis protein MoaE n=1 Tax=Lactococcus allomyrinae TaxID=2419773 RepID=A0A387BH19_9LACT|nr:molybdenum cofactor biosynthesis protein MoaE [Lactococcus allomyrinae]AYG01554.1 molybdenum cofactor biosynthesis protein MoaE [Lactococcus allomyrinae]